MSLREPARASGSRCIARAIATGTVAAMVAACGLAVSPAGDEPPWKGSPDLSTDRPQPTADAAGLVPGCPVTLDEARAIVPQVARGPDVGEPLKTLVQDCQFWYAGGAPLGRPQGFSILVFDASVEREHMWDSVRTDPTFPNATDVPGVGDVAFATGEAAVTDFWAVRGRWALHLMGPSGEPLDVNQYAALARTAFARLGP